MSGIGNVNWTGNKIESQDRGLKLRPGPESKGQPRIIRRRVGRPLARINDVDSQTTVGKSRLRGEICDVLQRHKDNDDWESPPLRIQDHGTEDALDLLHSQNTWIKSSPTDKAKYVTSLKGTRILVIGSYRHCMHKVVGAETHWVCSTHRVYGRCRATVYTVDDRVIAMDEIHNH
ncbi:hypothetical protein EVAR_17897_1 [Eumeta japonica]|uniref:FLYWCH-type domain-containing protein n=1 Tax=Eumeta variegata TaxID=151549 RepID=A0A4C1UY74_EUMVA|nr:hypothetical protein EVAR_17897_1 [Eumeta japonica]